MTSKPIRSHKIVNGRLVRVSTYRAKNKKIAADREAKAWQKAGRKT